MKRVLTLAVSLVLAMQNLLYAQQTSKQLFSAETITVERFNGQTVYPDTKETVEWVVRTSKGSASTYPKIVMANAWPEDKYGVSPENAEELKAFSINASFMHRGYNWVEISPGRNVNGKLEIVPLELTPEVKGISVWVWGSNYNFDLDVVVVDREGIEHRLRMGKLNFMGWRNMSVLIPKSVAPKSIYPFGKNLTLYPFGQNLKLRSFIITTNPRESAENFYVYFSDVTTSSVVRRYFDFDGSDLVDPKKVAEVWSNATTAPGNEANANVEPTTPVTPAQVAQGQAATPPIVGSDNPAYQKLQEVSVNKFEDPAGWTPHMSGDFGYIVGRKLEGGPQNKQPIANEEVSPGESSDNSVLGVKVSFIRRGLTPINVTAFHPIPIDGLVKVISVWVAGRNVPHKLSILVRDQNNKLHKLFVGTLNFSGWKQMSVAIPSKVEQRGSRPTKVGLSVVGFEIDTDLDDSRGTYYVYFDDMRAWIDFAAFEVAGSDDPVDAW